MTVRTKLYREIKGYVSKMKVDGVECFKITGQGNMNLKAIKKTFIQRTKQLEDLGIGQDL